MTRIAFVVAWAVVLLVGTSRLAAAVEADPATKADPSGVAQAAQPAEPGTTAAEPAKPAEPVYDHGAPRWYPPEAEPGQWEWVQLTSGEWLKGELKAMRRESFEFESDELDDLTLDWDDIAQFRSPKIHTYAFTERRSATGIGRIDKEQVVVLTALGEQTFPRSELLSIVSAGTSEWKLWAGKVSIGLTARAGNTDQVDATLMADIKRRTAFTRLSLDYRGNFSAVSGTQTVNNQKFDGRVDRYLYKRLFITPATIEVYADEFQNIRYRVSPGAGIGYEVVDRSWLQWQVGLDGLYRRTEYLSVQQAGQSFDQDFALRVSTSWEIDITSRIDLDGNYSATIGIPDPGNTNQSATVTLSVEMTSILDLDVSFIWDRVGQPQANNQGVLPEKDDFKTTVGLGIDF